MNIEIDTGSSGSGNNTIDCLLLPVQNSIGARKKVETLIEELCHSNLDWKYVVNGIRSYLFNYIFDIIPHAEEVLPVLFDYLRQATVRKKDSALRASDTFFDRYAYVMQQSNEQAANSMGKELDPNKDMRMFKNGFDAFALEYLDLLIRMSSENFYFDNIYNRISSVGRLLFHDTHMSPKIRESLVIKINQFIVLQYKIYIKRSIVIQKNEIENIQTQLPTGESNTEFITLLESVSIDRYRERLNLLTLNSYYTPEKNFEHSEETNFSHNSRTWEQVSMMVKKMIENGFIHDNKIILSLFAYLVEKSNQGSDRELQLFMSGRIASVCSILDSIGKSSLFKEVIDLVLPPLLVEIERGGNYNSAFSTVYNIGKVVIESGNLFIIDYFEDILVKSKFNFPQISGIASDWSVIVNFSHLENIRTWMKLIELNPPVMKKLSASLIVNLKLGGVFLKDTDLFQRDISRLLNSNYGAVFYLVTSMAAVFPAFYHDIGATGNIRAFTEKIDTNHQMDDLIHFLRKQVHVESSSQTVYLFQQVMEFWMTGDKTLLLNIVPEDVYNNLDHFFRLINLDVHEVPRKLFEKARGHFTEIREERFWDFLDAAGEERLVSYVEEHDFNGVSPEEKEATLSYIKEYYRTRIPTEMTKILHTIRSLSGIDMAKTKIWEMLYAISDDDFRKTFDVVSKTNISQVNIEKFIIFLHVYRMLFDKYNFSHIRAIDKLEEYARQDIFNPPDNFFDKIKSDSIFDALEELLKVQHSLKMNILLSDQVYEPLDTVMLKRHIAFGIPSMYGSYKEKKFDTLKVFFHMNLIRVLFFESIIEKMHTLSNGRIEYPEIKIVLTLFYRTLLIDGLANQEMISFFNLMETPNMKISQFRDIVTNLLTIHGEISDQFNETFKYVCKEAILNIGIDNISKKYIPRDEPENIEIVIDRFLRDQVMQSPLLQLFDNYLIYLRDLLEKDIKARGDVICLNIADDTGKGNAVYDVIKLPDKPGDPYDPFDPYEENGYAPIHDIKMQGRKPEEGDTYASMWEVGSKAHGLLFAANMEGVNTPEGIILSAELYKRIEKDILEDKKSKQQMIYLLKRYVETFAGRRFGNVQNPLLLSVRSGAVFSMPGVMDTITNVGLSMEIIEFFPEKDSWFVYDCYRRFLQDLATSYFGLDRCIFQKLMQEAKEDAGVALKEKLSGKQMKQLTLNYKTEIEQRGVYIPDDPYEQLLYSILAVYRSWDCSTAKKYRKFINISDEWGTSVIVQRMVFGNISPGDITGVVHSQYLGDESLHLFGEYKTRAQGHDIVNGVAKVFPISEEQKKIYLKSKKFSSLENTNPEIYTVLFNTVKKIRDNWGNDLQIEFTVENGILYILQVRGLTNQIFETEEFVEPPDVLSEYLLGQGLAASGGSVCGRAVYHTGRIDPMRKKYKNDKLILVRPETSPEDVVGLEKSDGILTCLGGMTSHAVLQMRRFEKSGVSDFSIMKIDANNNCAMVQKETPGNGEIVIQEGDFIAIDGATGNVYIGEHETRKKRF